MTGLHICCVPPDEAKQRAIKQIELVGLAGFEAQYPNQLSGGMRQRVGLARALATDADILLMDEAFSALDPLIRGEMQLQLRELQSKLQRTIVFITHDLDEALLLGDHIAVLKDGELRQAGTAEDILFRPADSYVRRFVQDVNRLRVIRTSAAAVTPPIISDLPTDIESLYHQIDDSDTHYAFLATGNGKPEGVIMITDLEACLARGEHTVCAENRDNIVRVCDAVSSEASLEDILPTLEKGNTPLAVLDTQGNFFGGLSGTELLSVLVPNYKGKKRRK